MIGIGPSSKRRSAPGGFVRVALLLALVAILGGCGENYPELVSQQHVRVTALVRNLGTELSTGLIRNGTLIKQYARLVAAARPKLAQLTTELTKEATTDGLAFRSLRRRLQRVNLAPSNETEANVSLETLLRVEAATDPTVFNDSLIDVVNVLADLSDGKLARLHVPAGAPRSTQGAGSNLAGNPRYGQWRRDSSGNSFWVFYGQYAMMRSLFFSPRRYYYGNWYRGRGWSYYGNTGRHYYGSRADNSRWNRAAKTYPKVRQKSYGSLRSQRRLSTYGRSAQRSPGGAVRRASTYASSARGSARGAARSGGFRGK